MSEPVDIQWFPGHMAKTKRIIQSNLPLMDVVIELVDARAPVSSANPDLQKIIQKKPKLLLLNKSDSADPLFTNRWINYYKNKNVNVLSIDSKSGKNINKVNDAILEALKLESKVCKKTIGSTVKAMIVGIPNVGKSFFINKMAKKKKAKVENRPGVTRGKQWILVNESLEFLDMPGVLWPKFEDKIVGEKLAFLGSIKDNILDIESLACRLIVFLLSNYKNNIVDRYKLNEEVINSNNSYYVLEAIGRTRGMVISGGEIDLERVAHMILDEFRTGKLGNISLDVNF